MPSLYFTPRAYSLVKPLDFVVRIESHATASPACHDYILSNRRAWAAAARASNSSVLIASYLSICFFSLGESFWAALRALTNLLAMYIYYAMCLLIVNSRFQECRQGTG